MINAKFYIKNQYFSTKKKVLIKSILAFCRPSFLC